MNQVDSLEKLKSIKRKAKASYNCLRAIYNDKLSASSNYEKKVFYEAISALDAMYRMYEMLKTGMRKEPIDEHINFASYWDTYISGIEAMTAYKTKDRYLLNGVTIDEVHAKQTALNLYRNFSNQISSRNG